MIQPLLLYSVLVLLVVFSDLFYDRVSGVEGAMEWLLIHESDPDIDEPLETPVETETESSKTATRSHSSKSHRRREFVPNKKVSKLYG